MAPHNLRYSELRKFKEELTDENALIAEAVAEILPGGRGGIILDVGAGLGDIAARAFPERRAILLDILEFPPTGVLHHERVHCDFFRYAHPQGSPIDTVLLSHVLQYLDSDVAHLRAVLDDLDADSIITVLNDPSPLQAEAIGWLTAAGVEVNPEQFGIEFLPARYARESSVAVLGTLRCPDFSTLADQLGRIVFDASIAQDTVGMFANWLQGRCPLPEIQIPQTVSLFARSA